MTQTTPTTGLVADATAETFDELVRAAGVPVLVEFWATWCGPCRRLGPVLAELAAEHADSLRVVRVDIGVETELARDARVLAAPTMHVYSGGELVKTMVGAAPKAALRRELDPYLGS